MAANSCISVLDETTYFLKSLTLICVLGFTNATGLDVVSEGLHLLHNRIQNAEVSDPDDRDRLQRKLNRISYVRNIKLLRERRV